jgi:hypothetical protein
MSSLGLMNNPTIWTYGAEALLLLLDSCILGGATTVLVFASDIYGYMCAGVRLTACSRLGLKSGSTHQRDPFPTIYSIEKLNIKYIIT